MERMALRNQHVKSQEAYLVRFYGRSRHPREKISSYCRAIETLFDKGCPEVDATFRESFLKAKLMPQIPQDMRLLISFFGGHKSWSELVDFFERKEQLDFI